jgi:hypothetical protein
MRSFVVYTLHSESNLDAHPWWPRAMLAAIPVFSLANA